jgi:hypothetical protein
VRAPLLFALALLGGCGPPETGNYAEGAPPPAPGGNRWRYSLDIPARFVREDVQGIDSAVARYHAPNVVLSMDHGMYGGAPTCSSDNCELVEEKLDGHDAVIGRYRFRPAEENGRGPFFVDVYVELGRHSLEEGLNMRAHCRTQVACDQALAIFRNVRFQRL